MVWAADAVREPDPQELLDSGCLFIARYVGTRYQAYGTSRAYIDRCHAVGLGVGLIFEEWSSQFLGGYDAAVQCCARMMAGWDALGAPRDGSVIPLVVMVDPNPGAVYGAEGALQAFARGWEDSLPFPAWVGYGSRYGLDLAAAVAPRMTRKWGVRTWGYQGVDVDMAQEPNIAPPVGGTDYNSLTRSDMGQWGGQGSGPAPEKEKDPIMWTAIWMGLDGLVYAWAVAGSTILYAFTGPPEPVYGIPQDAIDAKFPIVRVDDKAARPEEQALGYKTALDVLNAASRLSLTPPSPGDGTGITPEQKAAVAASVDAQQKAAAAMAMAAPALAASASALADAFK